MQLYLGEKLVQPYEYKIGRSNSMANMLIKGTSGVTIMYRYFILKVFSILTRAEAETIQSGGTVEDGTCTIIQYSKLKFIDKSGNEFQYPEETRGYPRYKVQSDIDECHFSPCQTGEIPENGISDSNNGKFCAQDFNRATGGKVVYDLGSDCLNVKIFNRWTWWNSNDSYSCGRYMYRFAMYVTNDKDNESKWVPFDEKYKDVGCAYAQFPQYDKNYVRMYTSDYFDYKTIKG